MNKIDKQIFLDHLPRYKGNFIDWINSIGLKVEFIYGDIKGYMDIIDYKKETHLLKIKYLNNEFIMHTNGFKRCCFGEILKVKTIDYKYELKEVINNMELLETIRIIHGDHTEKGYKYQCLKCGYKGEMYEYQFTGGTGCQACCNRIIVKGINDIATTNPEYIKYFVNIEDAYKYSRSANKNVKIKCPDCGYIKTMTINSLTNTGFACNKCGDGISYPEKFMFCLLEQLNLDFTTRKIFKWSLRKEYDFYISLTNCIIETHGIQHYVDFKRKIKGYRSLEEEQENDRIKKELAKENNIQYYIVLDCRESNLDYIKNTILNSELTLLYDLSNIDWIKCGLFAESSIMKKVCELWDDGLNNTTEIAKITKLAQGTIINYLKRGTRIGLCSYINCKEMKRVAVYDLQGQELGIFKSLNNLARQSKDIFEIKFSTGCISSVCNGKTKTHKGYIFKFV